MPDTTATINFPAGSLAWNVLTGVAVTRANHVQDSAVEFPVLLTDGRVHDSGAHLPTTAASDDLGIGVGTIGTGEFYLTTSDAKATTVTQNARYQMQVPYDYDAGETFQLIVNAGMNTTVSDGTATVDLEVYKSDLDGTVGSDLCATAAQSINSLTAADKTFTVTAASLNPGDLLDVRVTIAITDSATGTAVIGRVNSIRRVLDCRG